MILIVSVIIYAVMAAVAMYLLRNQFNQLSVLSGGLIGIGIGVICFWLATITKTVVNLYKDISMRNKITHIYPDGDSPLKRILDKLDDK